MSKGIQLTAKNIEEDASDSENGEDSYETINEEIDEKIKIRAEIEIKKVLNTDNGEKIKIFKRKADIHSLNLGYFKENEIGKREIKDNLQLKIKKEG